MKNRKGMVGIFVLIVISVLLLSYLGFDLKKIFSSEAVKGNFAYLLEIIQYMWTNFLSKPFTFIWSEAIKPLLEIAWKAFQVGIESVKSVNASK